MTQRASANAARIFSIMYKTGPAGHCCLSVRERRELETARLSDGEGRITGCNGNEVSTRLITVQTMQRSLLIDDDMLESIFAHITPALPRTPSARVVHVLTGAPYAITGSAAAARARQQGLA